MTIASACSSASTAPRRRAGAPAPALAWRSSARSRRATAGPSRPKPPAAAARCCACISHQFPRFGKLGSQRPTAEWGHDHTHPRRHARGDRVPCRGRLRQRQRDARIALRGQEGDRRGLQEGDAPVRAVHARPRRRHARSDVQRGRRPHDDARGQGRRSGQAAPGRAGLPEVPGQGQAAAALGGAAEADEGRGAEERAVHARSRHRLPRPAVRRGRTDDAEDRPELRDRPEEREVPGRREGVPEGRAGRDDVRRPAERGRQVRRLVAAGIAAAGALAAGGALALGGSGRPEPAKAAATSGPTTAVERRDLVDRENLDGTLGYDDGATLNAGAAGVLTRLPDPGTVITRGHSLYDVSDKPAAFLLYGDLPAWRDLTPSMTDGEDIRQLERNLKALGYDPGTVDDDWDWETTNAVEDFQDDRGLDQTGTLKLGTIVFRPQATRIASGKATVGDNVSPGRPLAEISSTRRVITVNLDARRQRIARMGHKVTVEMPEGDTATGRITDVGTVATKASEDSDPTIAVKVELRGKAAHGTRLDQAPVGVGFAVEQRKDVLAVPVKALVARQGGGYAVETPGGQFVAVEPGLYADDYVEVSGDGLREGMRVVTAE